MSAEPKTQFEEIEANPKNAAAVHPPDALVDKEMLTDAFQGENNEHQMGSWEAAKNYPTACFWAFIMAFTIVMESFDMFLNGNFVALGAFKNKYGTVVDGAYSIPTRWQSALFQSGQCGAFIGVFLAGPVTNRLGYRWTTILALMLMNATIFISFFVRPLPSLEKDR